MEQLTANEQMQGDVIRLASDIADESQEEMTATKALALTQKVNVLIVTLTKLALSLPIGPDALA